jgi:hypothetical protein
MSGSAIFMGKLYLESPKMQIRALRDATRDMRAEWENNSSAENYCIWR